MKKDSPLPCGQSISTDGPAAVVKLPTNFQGPSRDSLDLLGAEVRDDLAPLPHGGESHVQRARDVAGTLKVIDYFAFKHSRSLTAVKGSLQPQSNERSLTSVAMDKRLISLADRLKDAMRVRSIETGREITKSDLARACQVSPAAVSKWLDGQTRELKAQNYRDAARALNVSEDWLRDGTLPRERGVSDQADAQLEHVFDLLDDLRGPLTALVAALDQINRTRPQKGDKRRKA